MSLFKAIRDLFKIDEYEFLDDDDNNYQPSGHILASERPEAHTESSELYRNPFEQRSFNRVVNISATAKLKVVLVRPDRFEAVAEIANHLHERNTVFLNLEKTSSDIARRIIDFLSGVAYAQDGRIKKVAVNTYLIIPYNVDLMGDIIDELDNKELYY